MTTEHRDLIAERRDGVLYLTMNRPDKLNALSDQMIAGLLEELNRAAHDREVGAVVLTGAGRGFCAGGDIGRMRERNEGGSAGGAHAHSASAGEQGIQTRISQLRRSEEVSLLLHEMPKVTIGAINGPAAGAGLSIALACDLRLASDNARFGTAFARVGFSGDFGGTYLLTQLVGPAKARELYFTAEVIGAEEALADRRGASVCPAPRGRTNRGVFLHEGAFESCAQIRPADHSRSRIVRTDADRPDRRPQGSGQGVSRKARGKIQRTLGRSREISGATPQCCEPEFANCWESSCR